MLYKHAVWNPEHTDLHKVGSTVRGCFVNSKSSYKGSIGSIQSIAATAASSATFSAVLFCSKTENVYLIGYIIIYNIYFIW